MTGRMHRFVAAAAIVTLAGTGAAMAQGPRAGGPRGFGLAGGPGGRMGGLPLAALNLTQAQQDFIRDVRERGRESARSIEERLRAAQQVQRQAVETVPVNDAAIRTATLALAEVQADLAIHQARLQTEIWNALTPEQQARVTALRAERRGSAGNR